ncbi:MAG: glycosyltransferase family 9 protein [Thermodesulfobacteriota bacterium]
MGDVVLIRPGALGDTILTLPLVRTIQSQHPHAKVTFLGTGAYGSLVSREVEFHPVDGVEWLWLFGSEGSAGYSDLNRWEEAYVVLARPDTVIFNLRRAGLDRIRHTTSVPYPGRHLVETLHEGLGLPVPSRIPALAHEPLDRPRKQPLPAVATMREGAITASGESPKCRESSNIPGLAEVPPRGASLHEEACPGRRARDLIWMHPGSGGARKCLPLAEMVRLGLALKKATGGELAVTLGEADSFLKKDPAWHLLERAADLVLESRSLVDLVMELGWSRAYVGHDSGVSHLAAALGIPSLIFYRATDPACWSPWVPAQQVVTVDLRAGGSSIDAAALVGDLLFLR